MSSEHFSVDGTLLEAWASHKSFKPNDTTPSGGDSDDDEVRPVGRNSEVDWRGQKRSSKTHTSTTDPEARLARKSMNTAARLPKTKRRRTVGADKGYDTTGFVAEVRDLGFTPHVAQHDNGRRSAIDGRTTRHPGHRVSQRIRPRIEEPFGWMKTIAGGTGIDAGNEEGMPHCTPLGPATSGGGTECEVRTPRHSSITYGMK